MVPIKCYSVSQPT